MKIKLNGKITEITDGKTLFGLIAEKKLDKNKVLASVNKKIVKAENFSGTILSENDEVELFNFVSGG
jgi:thiamine biosynthesis protein ThiS